jgi:hypothetical protein
MDLFSIPVQDRNQFGSKNSSWRWFMKSARWMFTMVLMLLPVLAGAQLIGDQTIVTQVPFGFMVANKIVPAGQWIVQRAPSGTTGILAIRNVHAAAGLFASASVDEMKAPAEKYALVFTRYGGQYFLSGIKLEGSRITYRLPESKAEVELRAQNVAGVEEVLVASLK